MDQQQVQIQIDQAKSWANTFADPVAGIIGGIILIGFVALAIVIWCRIWKKTGNSPFLGLLMFVPLVNFIMLLILAFSDWPIHREMRLLKGQAK